jgi:hypothetical protein
MLLVPFLSGSYSGVVQSAVVGLLASMLATTSPDVTPTSMQQPTPVLEIVKVYGKLAGPQCYGKQASRGSSCQVTLNDIKTDLGFDKKSSLTREEFRERLNALEFQWPLKPYGIDKSLSKTATMNKGAETRVFMDEIERRGLYDRRNPAGPLPTSLRPQLNKALQEEGVDGRASDRVFDAMRGKHDQLQADQVYRMLQSDMDYYGFLDLIGNDFITWP